MVYYVLGSILFTSALVAAFVVMTREFTYYWHAMKVALHGLSFDGLDTRPTATAVNLTTTRPTLSRLPRAA